MKKRIIPHPPLLVLVIALCIAGCAGHGKFSADISVPEDMPVCPEGVKATEDNSCFEDNCGKYWTNENFEQAIMNVNDCRKRNIEILKYYLDLNRSQLLYIKEELE